MESKLHFRMLSQITRALVLLIVASSLVYSDEPMPKSKQTARTLNKKISKRVNLDYLLFLPDGYQSKSRKRWPLIFFLHGMGERGSDPWKVKVHGPPKVAE